MAKTPIPGAADRAVKTGSALVKVRALVHLHEDAHHNPGEEFETTPERAAGLVGLVELVDKPAAKAAE